MRYGHHYNQVSREEYEIDRIHDFTAFSCHKKSFGFSFDKGDKVLARKHSAVNVVYEGVLMALKDDNLVTIQFKDDFVGAFDNKAYVVDFDFSRAQYIRTHYAIDKAINMFKMSILNPIEIARREKPILDVHVTTKGKLKNGKKQLKWFNPLLNDTQKETVANILRGDILNPYVIYGPPGKVIHLYVCILN